NSQRCISGCFLLCVPRGLRDNKDKKRPFILGTPILTTAKAVIKFDKGTITLKSGKSKISFHRIPESLCKVEKGIKNEIEPIAPTMTVNRLVLKWKEKIKFHQEKEMKFDQWRSKNFRNKHPALVKVKSSYPSLWLDIIHEVKMFKSRGIDLVSLIHSKLGNGVNTSFWEVAWRGRSPFKSLFPRLYALETQKKIDVTLKLSHLGCGRGLTARSAVKRLSKGHEEFAYARYGRGYKRSRVHTRPSEPFYESHEKIAYARLGHGYKRSRVHTKPRQLFYKADAIQEVNVVIKATDTKVYVEIPNQ
nr:hypothetical protein [Tanacetum cinerariifolium]